MLETRDEHDLPSRNQGPSWLLMLGLIFLAMLVALAIAWAFISPQLHH